MKLLFSNSNLISLGPNSTIKISGKESPVTQTTGNVKNISSAMLVDLSAFILMDTAPGPCSGLILLQLADPLNCIDYLTRWKL